MDHSSFNGRLAATMHVTISTASTFYAQIKMPETWTPVICALIGLAGVYLQLLYQDRKERAKSLELQKFIAESVRYEMNRGAEKSN